MELRNLKGLRRENPRAARGKKRCKMEVLEYALRKPPPKVEVVDELEIYLLDDQGKRKRRICGHHRKRGFPSVVPAGMLNPHGVVDPYDEYRCTSSAGLGFAHLPQLGPCKYHAPPYLRTAEGTQKRVRAKHLQDLEGSVDGITSLEEQLGVTMANMSVEELLDGTRLLWRIEALRQMAEGDMEDSGYDTDRANAISNLLERMVNMRLKMAKTDNEIIKTQAIANVLQVVLNGVVAIVEELMGPADVAKVLTAFKERLVIPLTEQGFS